MNLIIKILAMALAVISVVVLLFVASVGGLMYVFFWLVGALSALTVIVYQWWAKLLMDVKGLGSADTK